MVRTSHQPITGDPIRETFTALRCVREDGLFAREGWAAAVGKCLRKEIPSLRCVRDYGPPLVQGGGGGGWGRSKARKLCRRKADVFVFIS